MMFSRVYINIYLLLFSNIKRLYIPIHLFWYLLLVLYRTLFDCTNVVFISFAAVCWSRWRLYVLLQKLLGLMMGLWGNLVNTKISSSRGLMARLSQILWNLPPFLRNVLWDMIHKLSRLGLSAAWYAKHFSFSVTDAFLVPMFIAGIKHILFSKLYIFLAHVYTPSSTDKYLIDSLLLFVVLMLITVICTTRVCVSRFKDCPLCGADIEKTEADTNLQTVVDRFIEGHARIKRRVGIDQKEVESENKTMMYEDVSLERGAFLVQQAMRVLCNFPIFCLCFIHFLDDCYFRISGWMAVPTSLSHVHFLFFRM